MRRAIHRILIVVTTFVFLCLSVAMIVWFFWPSYISEIYDVLAVQTFFVVFNLIVIIVGWLAKVRFLQLKENLRAKVPLLLVWLVLFLMLIAVFIIRPTGDQFSSQRLITLIFGLFWMVVQLAVVLLLMGANVLDDQVNGQQKIN